MPILGKSARACFDAFVGHLNPLVHATLPTKAPLYVEVLEGRPNFAVLGFQGVYTIPLASTYGTIYVHLGQSLECTEDKKRSTNQRFQLRTRKYWYRIQRDRGGTADALVRWEYLSPTLDEYADHGNRWCWRHVQMSHEMPMPKGKLDLDKAHTPCGFVLVEDIIRFLISDLGVKPPCGKAQWHKKLIESEKKFFHEFNAR